jgi:hypothetical protein
MGPCFVRGREPAGNANCDAKRIQERGKAILQPLAAHSDLLGQCPAGLNRLDKRRCQRVCRCMDQLRTMEPTARAPSTRASVA